MTKAEVLIAYIIPCYRPGLCHKLQIDGIELDTDRNGDRGSSALEIVYSQVILNWQTQDQLTTN